jgi:nucleoside-diphosphate-sugar epimerase
MKALVTGGTGFVGSHLLETLLRRGDSVRALVRAPAKAQRLGLQGVEWIRGDLDDEAAMGRAAEGVDVIYHVAGLVAARGEAEFRAVNVEGTRRLLEAAAPFGPRFVLVSSLAAGGPSVPGRPLAGTEPPQPVTAYGRSKLAAEDVVRGGPLPWTIIRPPAVYGPRDRELFRVFRAAQLGVAPVFGAGDQELSLVFGPDLAEAIAEAGTSAAAAHGLFYAAHPEVTTAERLVRQVAKGMGRDVRVIRIPVAVGRAILQATGAIARLAHQATILTADKGNELFQAAWTCDPASLVEATGWRAGHDLDAGIARTVAWYRAAGWL